MHSGGSSSPVRALPIPPRYSAAEETSWIPSLGGPSQPSSYSSTRDTQRPKRRMSIDPAPVSQLLQNASSFNSNYFAHPYAYSQPGAYPQPSISFQSLTRQGPSTPSGPPKVRCMARTRVPTPHGELFLHLYHNSHDAKEHLAIVVDPIQLSLDARRKAPAGRKEIRSRSLEEEWRIGETEMERVVRGAYVGRLLPGGEGQASVPRPAKGNEIIAEEGDVLDGVEVVGRRGRSGYPSPRSDTFGVLHRRDDRIDAV